MRILRLAALLVLLPALASAAPLKRVRIDTHRPAAAAAELERRGFDILEGSVTDSSLEVVVRDSDLQVLESEGWTLRLLETGRPFREIEAERQGRAEVPAGYPDLAGVIAQMDSLATAFPAICQLVDLTVDLGAPPTFEGRHLHAVKVSDNVSQEENEPAFLLVGAHHCREIVTPVIALYSLEQLLTGYGIDPAITAVVDSYEIWIAPVWNPDGYEYVFSTDNLWRKNRRVFLQGIGVDQNRNYPHGWSNPCSGSDDPSSLIYKGPGPASEPETQTMISWSRRDYFAKVLDFHSSGRETLHGYACWDHPFDPWLEQEAIAVSDAAGYAGSHRSPSADGEHFEWQLGVQGAHAFLVETAEEFQPTYASALAEAAQLWPATLWMLERPVPLWGFVTDTASETAIDADITYVGVNFEHGETVPTDPATGRYHAFLPSGIYDVQVEAEGYLTQVIPGVAVNGSATARLDVQLTQDATSVLAGGSGVEETRLLASDVIRRTVRFQVGRPVRASLAIHDVRGALVRTLDPGVLGAGQYEWVWNGLDDRGAIVASGAYFFHLRLGERAFRGKMLQVR